MGIEGLRKRLLIIDDDALIRRSMQRLLSGRFEVIGLPSAEDALELLVRDVRFDVILCDKSLGRCLSGRDFYELLLVDHPALAERTVIMSGSPRPEDPLGHSLADRWLVKPFETSTLFALVERLGGAARNDLELGAPELRVA